MKLEEEEVQFAQDRNLAGKGQFAHGLKSGVSIAIGYIPIAIAFGLMARSANVPNSISMLMSFTVFAGASQFVGVNLISVGAASWEIIMTTFILNLRHFLMTASISQRIKKGTTKKWMALLAFGITDETFSVASLMERKELGAQFMLGLNLISFSAWNIGTWIGIFIGAGLPEGLKASMGIALYSMFIGLLVPAFKKSVQILTVSLFAVAFSSILYWMPIFKSISTGWTIIITTTCAAFIGAAIFPEGVNE